MPAPTPEESFRLIEDVLEGAEQVRPKDLVEMDLKFAPVVSLFWRSVSMQQAILILLKAGHAEEAFALGRSLFDDALHLHELSVVGDRLVEYVLHWKRCSLNEEEGLFQEARRLQYPGTDEELSRLAKERKKLEGFAERNGIKRGRAFLSVKDAASAFGRGDDFWMYRLAEEMVHGSDVALALRRQRREDGSFLINSRSQAPWLVAGIAGFSARSLMQSLIATKGILKWKGDQIIAVLGKRVEAFGY